MEIKKSCFNCHSPCPDGNREQECDQSNCSNVKEQLRTFCNCTCWLIKQIKLCRRQTNQFTSLGRRSIMDAKSCLPEQYPPVAVCVQETARILVKYFTGRYNISTFDAHVKQGVAHYPSLTDATVMTLMCALFYFIHRWFHHYVHQYLSGRCPRMSESLKKKMASNAILIFEKVIIIFGIIYVLTFDTKCSVATNFSTINGAIKPHSIVSSFVHLFVISNYIFKLFAAYYLSTNRTGLYLQIPHHFIAIFVIGLSYEYNQ